MPLLVTVIVVYAVVGVLAVVTYLLDRANRRRRDPDHFGPLIWDTPKIRRREK